MASLWLLVALTIPDAEAGGRTQQQQRGKRKKDGQGKRIHAAVELRGSVGSLRS